MTVDSVTLVSANPPPAQLGFEDSRWVVEPQPSEPTPLPRSRLEPVLEALLFIGCRPLEPRSFLQAYPNFTEGEVRFALRRLATLYQAQCRPYEIIEWPEGFGIRLTDEFEQMVRAKLRVEKSAKLSRQAIETLSVVAYRQPITREQIETLVGNPVGSILRQLVRRGLIALADTAQTRNCYVTTPRFLDVYGMTSIEDLPVTDDLSR